MELDPCVKNHKSAAQWGFHDLWVMSRSECKREGYYVEIGVYEGDRASNTYKLDKDLGWRGLCIDPKLNNMDDRTCTQVKVAAGDRNGYVSFVDHKGLSGITDTVLDKNKNVHAEKLSASGKYQVEMKKTGEIFDQNKVPRIVDYLSLDVEGSESMVLNSIPLDKYCFRTMSVETNNQKHVAHDLRKKLEQHGYVYWGHSGVDDFYVHNCAGYTEIA